MAETGRKYYPGELSLAYNNRGSVYGEPSQGITVFLNQIQRRRIVDPSVGDGKYVGLLLGNNNVVFAGDLNKTVDRNGVRPLDALRTRFPDHRGRGLVTQEMNAFGRLPLADRQADIAVSTGFAYLFPPELIRRHVEELARVAREGIILDFATGITREPLDPSSHVAIEDAVVYSTKQGLAVVRDVLMDEYEPPVVGFEQVDQILPDAGYRMRNTKINIMARRRR